MHSLKMNSRNSLVRPRRGFVKSRPPRRNTQDAPAGRLGRPARQSTRAGMEHHYSFDLLRILKT
jgi:hypothetical protein